MGNSCSLATSGVAVHHQGLNPWGGGGSVLTLLGSLSFLEDALVYKVTHDMLFSFNADMAFYSQH